MSTRRQFFWQFLVTALCASIPQFAGKAVLAQSTSVQNTESVSSTLDFGVKDTRIQTEAEREESLRSITEDPATRSGSTMSKPGMVVPEKSTTTEFTRMGAKEVRFSPTR